MPLKYAIQEIIPGENVLPKYAGPWNSEVLYHSCSQADAEADPKGFLCVVNNRGDEVTSWIPFNKDYVKIGETLPAGSDKFGHLKDITGEVLALGDFVALSSPKNTDLAVGKVVAFTDKKVRILLYRWVYQTSVKYPQGLIKIQPSVLSD